MLVSFLSLRGSTHSAKSVCNYQLLLAISQRRIVVTLSALHEDLHGSVFEYPAQISEQWTNVEEELEAHCVTSTIFRKFCCVETNCGGTSFASRIAS